MFDRALGQVRGMGPKLAAWTLRQEAGAIGEVTIAIGYKDHEESSRRCSPQGTCWIGPCSFFIKCIEIYVEGYTKLWTASLYGPLAAAQGRIGPDPTLMSLA
jgi:hypothetical protein